jgi:hypothetical protein
MSLTLHWRILVGAVLAVMVAAFVLPPLAPEPDLRENRKLAALPAWPGSFAELKAYREGLDAYVADHFPARAQLIATFNYIRLPFGISGSPRVIVGKDGWLFYDDGSHFGPARGDPAIAEADTRAWLKGLAGRTEALKAKGVPYIVMAAPLKETVYPQHAPDWYGGPNPDRPSVALTALADRSGLGQVIHFGPPVSHAARSGVKAFSTYDTHWAGAGAYAAYVELMERLRRLGVTDEAPRLLSDFAPVDRNPLRDLAQMLGIGHFLRLEDVLLSDPLAEQRQRTIYLTDKEDWTAPHVIETGQTGKPTLLITVDSFSNALLPFLYSHFSRIVVAHNQDGTWREDLMNRFHPDVVMLEVIESGLRFTLSPAPEPSPEALARIDRALADPNGTLVTLARGRAVAVPAGDAIMQVLAKAEPAPGCNPEVVRLTPGDGPRLKLEGWISHLGRRPAPTIGLVRFSGEAGDYLAPIRTDRPRPDVEAHFSNPMARLSGFSEEVALDDLPPGDYRLVIYRRVRTRWIYCPAPQPISIDRPGRSQ